MITMGPFSQVKTEAGVKQTVLDKNVKTNTLSKTAALESLCYLLKESRGL